jgi:hypothetical protein
VGQRTHAKRGRAFARPPLAPVQTDRRLLHQLQVGSPSGAPAATSEPTEIVQLCVDEACEAVPVQPVAEPAKVSVTPDEPAGAA